MKQFFLTFKVFLLIFFLNLGIQAKEKKHHHHWKKKYQSPLVFFGDVRLRQQIDYKYINDNNTVKDDSRAKFQYRLRLGTKYKIHPNFKFLVRFRSKSYNYHSTSHTFGMLDVAKSHVIGVDQVYGEYQLYSEKSENSKFNLKIKVGKFSPPIWNQSGVYLDKDIQFDGSAIEISFLNYFKYSLAKSIIRAEKMNNGFTSDVSRIYGDSFWTNQLKVHFPYKKSHFTFGATLGLMSDGDTNKNEVQPITLTDLTTKYFDREIFGLIGAKWKNKNFPIHFSLGAEFLMSSADNGDKKNSRGHVLLLKTQYKKLILATNYYNVGDASAPFIGGNSIKKSSLNSSEKSLKETDYYYHGYFLSQDSFYSLNQSTTNGYKGATVGFTGFLYKVAWKFSDSVKLNFNLYQLKLKKSNRFLAHKRDKSNTSYRTRFYLDVKF